jgi:hypothetical protein
MSCLDIGGSVRAVLVVGGARRVLQLSGAMGPVEAGPPKIRNVSIEGDFCVGGRLVAVPEYFGGYEGISEYLWMRIAPDGDRVDITPPRILPRRFRLHADVLQRVGYPDADETAGEDDPRCIVLTPSELGCRIKVKIRPARLDGELVRLPAPPLARAGDRERGAHAGAGDRGHIQAVARGGGCAERVSSVGTYGFLCECLSICTRTLPAVIPAHGSPW